MKRDLFGFFVPMCALLADVPMSLARHNGEPLGDLPGIWMAQQMGLASVGEAMALGCTAVAERPLDRMSEANAQHAICPTRLIAMRSTLD